MSWGLRASFALGFGSIKTGASLFHLPAATRPTTTPASCNPSRPRVVIQSFRTAVNEVTSLPPFHVPHFDKRPEKSADLSALIAVPQACSTHWTLQPLSCWCAGPCSTLGLRRCISFNFATCAKAWTSFRDSQMRRCAASSSCGTPGTPQKPSKCMSIKSVEMARGFYQGCTAADQLLIWARVGCNEAAPSQEQVSL